MNTYKRPFSSPYSETYNPNWRNHANFSWRNDPAMNDVNVPQGSSSSNPYVPPHKNSLEDTLHTFMQGQTQINQNVMKTLDELKTRIVRIESRLNVREKGKFPAQTQPNPKGQFEAKNSNLEQANVVTTLRSGKVIETPMKVNEPEKSPKLKSSHSDVQNEQSEIEKKMHAPFPNRLLSTKQLADNKDILDVFQQVKINIPLLSVIKQVPAYTKFLKDLCTVKRKHNVQKKAFLTEQMSGWRHKIQRFRETTLVFVGITAGSPCETDSSSCASLRFKGLLHGINATELTCDSGITSIICSPGE
ncbi:uncharacterized protein LOC113345757 isoform X1 [Papaver somniferum]|uniref:uncharacterized protein LOC113345757 isoform X1 n=1 Tax=Papaver somniferum TaxID=3469 RepID=UPI000E6F653B|nr:uncharacterized protein LOC113345757 isoform X1 [Papaver somniferum]